MQDVVIVVVKRDHSFLFLQRTDNNWTFPSGKVEEGESLEDAAERETYEETGVKITNANKIGERELPEMKLHYFSADYVAGEAFIVEPDKFQQVCWKTGVNIERIAGDRLHPCVRNAITIAPKRRELALNV